MDTKQEKKRSFCKKSSELYIKQAKQAKIKTYPRKK